MTTAVLTPVARLASPPGVRDEPLFEIVDGVRVELPEMSVYSNLIKSRLFSRLATFVEGAGIGQAAVETLFVLDPERNLQRRPDAAYVATSRWPLDRPIPLTGEWEVVPNVCIEVSSPSDLFDDLMDKVFEYLRYGVEQVWVIWPPGGQVQVFTSPTGSLVLGRGDDLTGGDVIPGFSVPLAAIFPTAPPATVGNAPAPSV